jgi:hypothetical protein
MSFGGRDRAIRYVLPASAGGLHQLVMVNRITKKSPAAELSCRAQSRTGCRSLAPAMQQDPLVKLSSAAHLLNVCSWPYQDVQHERKPRSPAALGATFSNASRSHCQRAAAAGRRSGPHLRQRRRQLIFVHHGRKCRCGCRGGRKARTTTRCLARTGHARPSSDHG